MFAQNAPAAQPLPGTIVPFPAPLPAPAFAECPRCDGNCFRADGMDYCLACKGAGVVGCACGACEAGIVAVGPGLLDVCAAARPATTAEASAWHDAWLAEHRPPAGDLDDVAGW